MYVYNVEIKNGLFKIHIALIPELETNSTGQLY